MVQHGFESSGVQFMLGLGLDQFQLSDPDDSDNFVRLEFGIGFGL